MVQLKGSGVRATASRNLISIPHGTIKSGRWRKIPPSRTLFQYLMVQLKVNAAFGECLKDSISIPHGTIKRCRSPWRLSWRQWISIPHGTIKSRCGLIRVFRLFGFQYLMVQLKVLYRRVCQVQTHIFQYLMVQLKDNVLPYISVTFFHFNTSWYN